MALIASLITGHGETEHITSFDVRAYNRATFGGGKYILQDDENLKTQVSALTGTIQISKGSCLWSGMHIRVEEEGFIPYTSPASTNYVYVWLHYMRNTETLVETVEFMTTTGTKPETDLIFDNLTEEVTEAYTLFCSFMHDTSTNSVIGLASDFSVRQPLDDTAKTQSSAFSSLQTNISGQIQEVDAKINELNENVSATSINIKTDLGSAVYLGSSGADGWIVFSESLLNFALVLVNVTCKGFTETKMFPRGYIKNAIPLNATIQDGTNLYAITLKLTQRGGTTAGTQYGVNEYYAFAHADKGTLGGGYTQTAISKSDVSISAYGLGKIQEA